MNNCPSLSSAEAGETLASVKDIVAVTGLSDRAVRRAIERTYPDKMKNGVKTLLTKKEATVIIDELKNNKTVVERIPGQSVSSLMSAETDMTPELMLAKANAMFKEAYEALLAKANARIEAMAPKVEAYDAITDSRGAIPMAEVAKVLGFKNIGRNKLFENLRDLHILQNNNIPYQRYIDDGYFRVIEQKYTTPDGETHISFKTLVFQRGIEYIRKQLIINHYVHAEEIMTQEAIEDAADAWCCEQEG